LVPASASAAQRGQREASPRGTKQPPPPTTPPAPGQGFELQLSCPNCGGPFVASDATVSHTCEHCKSLLIVEAPEREEVFVEPAQVSEPSAILETLIRYRVDAQRATLVAKHSDPEGNPPPDLLVSALLNRFESGLRGSAKLIDCRLVHVPYRQTAGKVVQAVLGRHSDGAKIARLRAYVAEQTSPAYDASRLNLRDTGLRLGRSIFRPLLSADVPRLGRFVPRTAIDASRRELEKWRGQNLEAGFESVAKQGQVAVTFEAAVYRPYYLVRTLLDRGDETLLFDGGFGTIAGHVTDAEHDAFMSGKDKDPLGTEGPSFRRVAVVPSRCPNCGMDPGLPEDAVMSICGNCHAGVAASPAGLVLMNYHREEGATPDRADALLPFWRFPFQIGIAGSPPISSLEAYATAIFPQGLPKGFSPRGDSVYVPAWRLLTTEAGDETFSDLARAVHGRAWNWTPDRVGLDGRPRFVPVSLPEEEARDLAWASLFALHTKTSAARLNTLLLKRTLFDAKLSFGRGSVALISFEEQDKVYARPEVSVARLLVDGGPPLAAQRVTVQAAAAAFLAAQTRPSMADRVKTSKYTGGEE
jgi:hypothetical protein